MAGSHDFGARLNQKIKEILKTHQPEPLRESVKAQVASTLANAKAQYPTDK